MSADNYYLIRKHPKGGYIVTNEFFSVILSGRETTEEVLERHPNILRYDTLEAAQEYANSEYAEYGVAYDFPTVTTLRTVEWDQEGLWSHIMDVTHPTTPQPKDAVESEGEQTSLWDEEFGGEA